MKIKALLLAALAAFLFASPQARAESQWQKTHPRRVQVNQRLKKQNRRLHQEVKEGDMSKKKAARLHRKDQNIRREERAMAGNNGGHLTKQEQGIINRQENRVSKRIGQ